MTAVSASLQLAPPQIVPHSLFMHTSILPSLGTFPPARRSCPSVQGAKFRKELYSHTFCQVYEHYYMLHIEGAINAFALEDMYP